jgi:hypothetical protein
MFISLQRVKSITERTWGVRIKIRSFIINTKGIIKIRKAVAVRNRKEPTDQTQEETATKNQLPTIQNRLNQQNKEIATTNPRNTIKE